MSTADAKLPSAPDLPGPPPHVLIIQAPYYVKVGEGLLWGAQRIMAEARAKVDVIDVAGALELAAAIRLAVNGRHSPFHGYVALGCVVKGETDHYEHVCREAMSGLTYVSLRHALCLGNGLLTVATEAQAIARSGRDGHNKGAEAAAACLLQIGVARRLGAG